MATNRQIQIDSNTLVGYNYIKSQYYVTNRSYTTYRTSTEEILKVLESLGITTITEEDLLPLKSDREVVSTIYYTWDESGAYINTLQFNDWEKYPLTIDCEKGKLYIMNTDIVYDLKVNESPKRVRIPYLCSYYKTKLGLDISQHDMLIYYNTLTKFYSPTVYVQFNIDKETGTPTYSNTFILSNYNNSSPAVYNGKYNALSGTTYTDIGDIANIDSVTRQITTLQPLTNLHVGEQIHISGTETTQDNILYSADGTYTISNIEDTTIEVAESIPNSYQFPYPTCNLILAESTIESIDSSTNTITLSHAVPENINIGDTVYIEGTTYAVGYSQLSCNGSYTVQSKDTSKKEIVVAEQLPCNYTGETGTIHTEQLLGNILSASDTVITISTETPLTILQDSKVTIRKPDNTSYTYTVASEIPTGSNTITVTSTVGSYTPVYPKVQEIIPQELTLINTTESTLDNFPIGEFMLDTFQQACNYIELSTENKIQVPTNEILNYILSVSVSDTYQIEETDTGISEILYKGIYTDIYKES